MVIVGGMRGVAVRTLPRNARGGGAFGSADVAAGARAREGRLAAWGAARLVPRDCAGDEVVKEFVDRIAVDAEDAQVYPALVFGEPDPTLYPAEGGSLAAEPGAAQACHHCALFFKKLHGCSKCYSRRYCGRNCQLKAWKGLNGILIGHKVECASLRVAAAAPGRDAGV